MKTKIQSRLQALLLGGAATAALLSAAPVLAQDGAQPRFDIPPQDGAQALNQFAAQAGVQIVFPYATVRGRQAPAIQGDYTRDEALKQLTTALGLEVTASQGGVISLRDPLAQGEGGSSGGAANDVEALIVTAQKREENIQDVPIAISAFSQKALEEQKIEGGYDLLKAIPNVTFSKSNFTSYNFSIRGVGTKAISATTDPGVAVAFNNTALIQNRLFEQEYFDVERVEVLRGPQGTLYGRNATSGVINVISAKPRLGEFEGSAKVEVGNYDTKRLVGMVNIPIVEDVLGVRLAGAGTQRSGYDYNEGTGNNVNGRELWSGRLSVGFEPTERLRTNFIWEHFEEDDNRSRTGKQLCHRDNGLQTINGTPVVNNTGSNFDAQMRPALFSQGCKAGSLYDEAAFGTPNGLALPFVFGLLQFGGDCGIGCTVFFPMGIDAEGRAQTLIKVQDPYGGLNQSRDLRTIVSFRDPIYRAKADVFELNIDFDITDELTFTSQTAYNKDEVYSFQDYNRFNTVPIFTDTSTLTPAGFGDYSELAPGGVFCDPQLGCTDKLAGFDISQATGEQFSQEVRIQSSYDGPMNFSLGANYTEFETLVDYYVMYNLITGMALIQPFNMPIDGHVDATQCALSGYLAGLLYLTRGTVPAGDPAANCPYIDPNPVESINGDGHNYFRSKNPYELQSSAVFGEFYWNVREDLKLTAGLRYTRDEKTFIPVPSQILLAPGIRAGGNVSRGYPEKPPIVQEWGEWTGRLGFDWKPELSFTEETMLYAFYSRGYKGGGANPPSPGFPSLAESAAALLASEPDFTADIIDALVLMGQLPVLELNSVEYGRTFEPEFVDALEIGAKNSLLGGAVTVNAGAFYYDYKDYQVSQIRDRTAVNENFDATIWGLELETTFAPSRDFKLIANVGYLDSEIAGGEESIDIMNRTQSNSGYVVVKPWAQLPSNCVIPSAVAARWAATQILLNYTTGFCGGSGLFALAENEIIDPNPAFGGGLLPYDSDNYPELNGGAGFKAQLGGNELPNAPHWTANIGGQYGRDIVGGSWRVTFRGDAYWQSQSWARVYNAVNDKLHGWYNLNVGVTLANEDLGVQAELYVKNLLDKSPITDAFLNSDDSGLTTNVFVLDPRLVGFSLRKTF